MSKNKRCKKSLLGFHKWQKKADDGSGDLAWLCRCGMCKIKMPGIGTYIISVSDACFVKRHSADKQN